MRIFIKYFGMKIVKKNTKGSIIVNIEYIYVWKH